MENQYLVYLKKKHASSMSSSDELLTYLKAGMWFCSLRYSISKQYLISLPASFAGYMELVNNLKAIEWDLNHNFEGDIQYVANKLTEFYPSQSPFPVTLPQSVPEIVAYSEPAKPKHLSVSPRSMRIGH